MEQIKFASNKIKLLRIKCCIRLVIMRIELNWIEQQ